MTYFKTMGCFLIAILLYSCNTPEAPDSTNPTTTAPDASTFVLNLPDSSMLKKGPLPIFLEGEKTIINLDDYFHDPLKIEYIKINSDKINHTFFLDEKRLELDVVGEPDLLTNMTMRTDGIDYDLLLARKLPDNVPPSPSKLSYAKGDANGMTINFTEKPVAVLAYWEGFKIPAEISDKNIQLELPTNAKDLENSAVIIYAHNGQKYFPRLEIPLKKGLK